MQELSCDFDPVSVSVADALQQIDQQVTKHGCIEEVPLDDAAGRISAKDIISRDNVPNHTNAAMDGYAFASADIDQSGDELKLELVGTAFAGDPYNKPVSSGQCVRIMTGAVMPEGADTVVIQERVKHQDSRVLIPAATKPGDNVRYAGEDIEMGEVAIQKGYRLNASRLGIVASLGVDRVCVYVRPRVAFFSNGDELRSVGEPLTLGEVYDSNRYTLKTMIQDAGAQAIDFGIVKDDEKAIADTLKRASEQADMVISTAGASVGDADYIKRILGKMGQVNFWKVAIKPGRPLSFGKVNNSIFFGLPGNPVSVMVTFLVFVKAAIKKLSGEHEEIQMILKARTLSDLKKRSGRMEYQRGILLLNDKGETTVQTTGDQGSGILSSMSEANCFILLEDDCTGVVAGEWVQVQPL